MYPSPHPSNPKDKFLQRVFETIPGLLSWFTLTIAIVASFIWPIPAALFVIAFDLYWLIRAVYMSIYLVGAYMAKKKNEKIDWLSKLKNTATLSQSHGLSPAPQEFISLEKFPKNAPDWQDIYHLIIFPTANEPVEVIKDAFNTVLNCDYPKDKMILILATEERDDPERRDAKEEFVKKEFKDKFFKTLVIRHPDGIKGEAKAKGANATWAAKKAKETLDELGINYENVIISAFDCDTCPHSQYFAYASYLYLMAPDRQRCSLQPLPMYHNNFWDAPMFVRVIAASSSFWHMIESLRPERLVTFASHSMSFKALVDVDYWPVNMISDDSVIFWKCYHYYNGDYRSIPMHMSVSLDAVVAKTYWRSIVNQYKQKRRWAWGVENFPLLMRSFIENKKIGFAKKMKHLFIMLEGNRSWATDSFIVVILGWLPLVAGGKIFNSTVLASRLPSMTRLLMTFAMIGLIVSAALGTLLLPPIPAKYRKWRYIYMILQWVVVPVVAPFLGALPALDAQTRLMLGKYMEFWVTEKVRK
ncbi:MAG: glycosyltransferase family 2 protein [bacterium]